MFEKRKQQYKEDCKNYAQPWEVWECRYVGASTWNKCKSDPCWGNMYEYRRKEPAFEPEHFSGLNWREAVEKGLVGQVVEYSDDPDLMGWKEGILEMVDEKDNIRFKIGWEYYEYIRTCPETYSHPTITIGDKKLPRPEIEAPEDGTEYWIFDVGESYKRIWGDSRRVDAEVLPQGIVHLTEDRAQAWADWWDDVVIKQLKG